MRKGTKVIISCAVTGSIHTPSMSPHLPGTPQQSADRAVGAVDVKDLASEIATPDEARAMLETKGRDKVGF